MYGSAPGGGRPPLNHNCYYGGRPTPAAITVGGSTGGRCNCYGGSTPPCNCDGNYGGSTPLCVYSCTCGCLASHVAARRHLRMQACTYKGGRPPLAAITTGGRPGAMQLLRGVDPHVITSSKFISAIARRLAGGRPPHAIATVITGGQPPFAFAFIF